MNETNTYGKAVTIKKMFSRETRISVQIAAETRIIWALLTQGADYPRWNSTIISIEGTIGAGQTINLRAKLDPKRTFKLKISEYKEGKSLVWGDAMGSRQFLLTPAGHNLVEFTMDEKIGGPLFPLFAGMIPPFDSAFEQFAGDLKREAEVIQNAQ